MTPEEIVKDMQLVVKQMYDDDVEENPDILNEFFDCSACGKNKCLAGSIQYGKYRLCNDCVLLMEAGLKLGKINAVVDIVDKMEDLRLEEICKFIKKDESASEN